MPKSKINLVKIDWPTGAPALTLCCPRTGNVVIKADDAVDQPASPYVTFVYVDEVGEFDFLRDDIRFRLEKARERLESSESPDAYISDLDILLEHTDLGLVPVVFEITTSGMACGPVSFTVHVGFDLWSADDDGE